MVKAERPFQVTSVASAPAPEPYARAVSGPDTIQLGEDFPSRCAVLVDLDTRTVLAEKKRGYCDLSRLHDEGPDGSGGR